MVDKFYVRPGKHWIRKISFSGYEWKPCQAVNQSLTEQRRHGVRKQRIQSDSSLGGVQQSDSEMRSCREERKSSIASWVAVQLHYHIKGVSRYRETLEHSRSNYRAVSSERCHFPLCSPSPFPVLIPTKKLARLLRGGNRSSSLSIEMGNRNGNVEQTAKCDLLSVQTAKQWP